MNRSLPATKTCAPRLSQHVRTHFATDLAAGLSCLALLLGSAGASLAGPGGGAGAQLTPAQQDKIFPEMKALTLKGHRARIAILQKGENCLAAAGTPTALRACMQQERSAYQAQRQVHRAEMRQMFERNGIPMPEWEKGGRKGGPGTSRGDWSQPSG